MEFSKSTFNEVFPTYVVSDVQWEFFAAEARALIPINFPNQVLLLLNTVAHLWLLQDRSVGRVNSASQGSVSVSTDYTDPSIGGAWWNQTQPGAYTWKLLKRNNKLRYYGARPKGWN